MKFGVGVAMHAVRHPACDLLAGEKFGRTLQDVGERQRVVHHQTLHNASHITLFGREHRDQPLTQPRARKHGLTLKLAALFPSDPVCVLGSVLMWLPATYFENLL